MITSIVFSKNRACQLDLFLRSARVNLPNFSKMLVLYRATSAKFLYDYQLLQTRFPDCVFVRETNFQADTISLLQACAKYVCFFVDDDVIYRHCSLAGQDIDNIFTEIYGLTCFSLRLGANTIRHDPYTDTLTPLPTGVQRLLNLTNEVVLSWDWTVASGNWNYPFSVDGHIYRTEDALSLMVDDFPNPNCLEGGINRIFFRITTYDQRIDLLQTNLMACCEQSVLVNNPINLVGSSRNPAGRYYGHTLMELNRRYACGEQIRLDSITKHTIHGCHQEIPIEFEVV